jgi:uncharacterized membrane protein YozB (DUF420 family)
VFPESASRPQRTGMAFRILPALFLGALLTSAWAWWLIAWPVAVFEASPKHQGHFALVYVHMLGGTTMLVLGAAALYVGWTRRQFRYHKVFGYAYLGGGAVGAAIAFVLALASSHRKPAGVPFALNLDQVSDVGFALATLSLAWLAVSAMAYRAARNRRFEAHRDWMIRSYVLTWTFVLCRLIGRIPALESLGDGAAIVWLSWIVPLLVCEVALHWSDTSPRHVRSATVPATAPEA